LVDIRVVPSAATVASGTAQRFKAFVIGATDAEVTWSVEGGVDNGTVSPRGVYWAPATMPDLSTVTVWATIAVDSTLRGKATVTIVAAGVDSTGLVRVPAGQFTMGDAVNGKLCWEREHEVTLTRDFYMGQTEVTNRQFVEMLQWAYDLGYVAVSGPMVYDRMDGQTGTEVPLYYLANYGSEIAFVDGEFLLRHAERVVNPENPIQEVSWYGAAAYCDWLSLRRGLPRAYDHQTWACNGGDPYGASGYRLPTEAEWEYAAQYDDERVYPWGNGPALCELANFFYSWDERSYCAGWGWTTPVGSYAAEKTLRGMGIFDMAGNVREWCNDWHACDLGIVPTQDPAGPTGGTGRVVRGGGLDSLSHTLICAFRVDRVPSHASYSLGFRVARTAGL
jgi:formylglycine-generating enzyme required for sulfatase activity